MAFELTQSAKLAFEKEQILPQLVMEIEGVDRVYGAETVKTKIKFDEGYQFDQGYLFDQLIPVNNQRDIISFEKGTSTDITQTLNSDKGEGSSVSSMKVRLVDLNGEATKLITPGELAPDILGRKVVIWYGSQETSWKQDFFIVFRGFIDDVISGPGFVDLVISHPNQRKRQEIFTKATSELNGAINASTTTIVLNDASSFLAPIADGAGNFDDGIEYFVRIDDEIIQYTGISGNTLTGVTRGSLSTVAASHDNDDDVESFFRIKGNAIDLSLKLMLSGWNGPYKEDISITSFNKIDGSTNIPNAIYFDRFNANIEFGIVVGDYVTITGSSNPGSNDVVSKKVLQVVETEFGSYIVVDDVTFVDEIDSSAVLAVRSQYDVFADGLKLGGEEVDIIEHLRLKDLYFLSFEYDFYLRDEINGKEFLDQKVYLPMGAFSLPRQARASLGVHAPPLPTDIIKTLNISTVTNPSKLQIRRTTARNFYNFILFKYEDRPLLDEDRFFKGLLYVNAESFDRTGVKKQLTVQASGLRQVLGADIQSNQAASRLLKKYKFGAETIKGVQINFGRIGVGLEIGDLVVLDLKSLQISDIKDGSRNGAARLFQVDNMKFSFTGSVTVDLIDTDFDLDARRALIGPTSLVQSGIDQQNFVIKPTLSQVLYGQNEWKKWRDFIGTGVRVRSKDFTTEGSSTIRSVNGNTITLETPLGFVPVADMIFEFDEYSNQVEDVKVRYGFISDGPFADGKPEYVIY